MPNVQPFIGSYFVTITLPPFFYKFQSTTQFELTAGYLEDILDQNADHYEFLPELTDQGNVHYHGWATFKDTVHRIKFMDRVKRSKKLGFLKINDQRIIDVERVAKYMTKSYTDTVKIIKSPKRLFMTDCATRFNMSKAQDQGATHSKKHVPEPQIQYNKIKQLQDALDVNNITDNVKHVCKQCHTAIESCECPCIC